MGTHGWDVAENKIHRMTIAQEGGRRECQSEYSLFPGGLTIIMTALQLSLSFLGHK
jgi:hypothetical protein